MRKVLMLALGICFVLGGTSFAFHDAGVADCAGCHTMHNSEDGALVDADSPNGNPWLLKDATPSDVCLSCHSVSTSRGVFGADVLTPNALNGAGDFVFLLEDNLNDGHGGASNPILGDAAGHNIVAPSKGVAADATLGVGPGGTFPSSALGCSSCHDPHGNTNYRLLYGAGRTVQDGLFTFANAAPTVDGMDTRTYDESNLNHNGYQGGMSAWCGNCHGDFHANNTKLIHKSGMALGGTVATIYNLYNGTNDITGGLAATAYLAAVPFEDAANTAASTAGPSASSQVMCLSCHRAHASSAPNAGRWDFSQTLIDEDGLESGSYAIPNPYADPDQRSLCNKCHAKDIDDHVTVTP
jgi:predicted CXXCH cytochrome family protein